MTRIYYKIITLLLTGISLRGAAQTRDSVAPIREFLRVSSSYRQAPLYLQMEMTGTSNFITGEEDTVHAEGKFYVLQGGSYMQMGELEQFITDSMALMVSTRLERMIVQTDTRAMRSVTEAFSGSLLKDASVSALSKKYTGSLTDIKGIPTIKLSSRRLLYNTTLPEENVEMQYDTSTKQPIRVVSTKRLLIPVSQEDFEKLQSQKGLDKFLLTIKDKGNFVIKEQSTSFIYKSIQHDPNIKIPVAVSDRLVKNRNGEFQPVKAYENYQVTIN